MKKLLIGLLTVSLIGMLLAPMATLSAPPTQQDSCRVSGNVVEDYPDTCGACGDSSGGTWSDNNDANKCQPICCILTLVDNVGTWFFWIVLIVAFIMLLWGAMQFMTAGGNEEQTAKARRTLIYALIGVAVAYFAQLLIDLAGNIIAG